jgi:hypothetical protein
MGMEAGEQIILGNGLHLGPEDMLQGLFDDDGDGQGA